MKDEMPLRCEAHDGMIFMGMGREMLKFAMENHPRLGQEFRISNAAVFAKAVVATINHEDEEGNTLLTRMLDDAILGAIENGCDGVDDIASDGAE